MGDLEREQRKSRMQTSNWVAAAEGGAREYIPVSSTPLDAAYQRSKSILRSELHQGRLESAARMSAGPGAPPAADFVARKHASPDWRQSASSLGANIVLGSDDISMTPSNTAYGVTAALPTEQIDLLQTVPKLRDSTMDGAHRASMTENHFISIWDPYISMNPERSRSYKSSIMLRDQKHRHVRSQYHPDERYVLPPTVQSEIGWGLTLQKYKEACAKFQEGAEWHGRAGKSFRA